MQTQGPEETFAFETVRRIAGCVVEPYDTGAPDRQGAVDALLHHSDGRTAALEVTRLTDSQDAEIEGALARDNFVWTMPQLSWAWHVEVTKRTDLRVAKTALPELLSYAEGIGCLTPDDLARNAHPQIAWYRDSGLRALGLPNASDGGRVHILPGAIGGVVGPPEAVPPWLTEELQTAHCGAKIEKLIRSGYDETHLFLHIDWRGAPFPVFYEMSWGETLPPESPDLPPRLTHVWLAPRWARTVLTYDEDSGWRAHHPYDN